MSSSKILYTKETEMDSKVYFMDARADSVQTGLVPKMLTVFENASFDDMIKPGDVVAIKVH